MSVDLVQLCLNYAKGFQLRYSVDLFPAPAKEIAPDMVEPLGP